MHWSIINENKSINLMVEVGPFFIIQNELYSYGESALNKNIDLVDICVGHMHFFDIITNSVKKLEIYKFDDYDEFPRGRVVYNNILKQSEVYIDKEYIANDDIKQKIIKEYNLNGNAIFKTDEHYNYMDMV